MKRTISMAAAAAICASAGAPLLVGAILQASPFAASIVSLATAAERGATIYYQDPDGKPFYAQTPKKTPDGRAWRAVPAPGEFIFTSAKPGT